ncbi:MAG: hypothetical protein J0H40_05690 [Rhizobiales bacterium]|nr:hypothetical protein [Hyphomicrobiales bacterium]
MSDAFTLGLGYEVVTCCKRDCLQSFAMTTAFKKARHADKRTFWCPNGHPQHFTSETIEERLQKNVAALQTRIGYRDAEISQLRNSRAGVERRLRATRGVVTRMRRKGETV